jgi:hypothetical protein
MTKCCTIDGVQSGISSGQLGKLSWELPSLMILGFRSTGMFRDVGTRYWSPPIFTETLQVNFHESDLNIHQF